MLLRYHGAHTIIVMCKNGIAVRQFIREILHLGNLIEENIARFWM